MFIFASLNLIQQKCCVTSSNREANRGKKVQEATSSQLKGNQAFGYLGFNCLSTYRSTTTYIKNPKPLLFSK